MNSGAEPDNPFCSSRVRPGAYLLADRTGWNGTRYLERLSQQGWWGQVIGPHGSGKSSLLAEMVEAAHETGFTTVCFELHDGQRRLPCQLSTLRTLPRGTLIAVDGYEQLGYVGRCRLRRLCRQRGLGLVITAHRSCGFPDLVRVTSSFALAWAIVATALENRPAAVSKEEVRRAFLRHDGNLREMLFDLYDLYEERTAKLPRP